MMHGNSSRDNRIAELYHQASDSTAEHLSWFLRALSAPLPVPRVVLRLVLRLSPRLVPRSVSFPVPIPVPRLASLLPPLLPPVTLLAVAARTAGHAHHAALPMRLCARSAWRRSRCSPRPVPLRRHTARHSCRPGRPRRSCRRSMRRLCNSRYLTTGGVSIRTRCWTV